MYEVIWHGRGGQGVVIAAQILAEAAYLQGFRGVTSAPTFGPERRGAPLTASTRISVDPVRMVSQIEHADISVVLDPSLLSVVNILGTLKEGGLIIINTPLKPDELALDAHISIATADAGGIAMKHRLIREGKPIVNTPMLGAFAKASGLVSVEALEKGLKSKLSATVSAANIAALRDAFEQTSMKEAGREYL
ncbi:MAG TPA: 2-oxoacid:acceptor oxidoreductase family protein [Syntrophales bacterium]|nr:2-oxoacid:acceptor oxidoreductase family protein [Syntrophales bacterium]